MNEAFNRMIQEADKDYFIQVDEDFILYKNCVEQLKSMIEKAPNNTVFLCADLLDVGRNRNVQGIKIYRTKLMKKYSFKNVIDCEMDLIRQIESDGNSWLLVKDVLGKHAPDYSPKSAFFRFKSMAEKQRFAFDVYSSDLYDMLEPITSDKDKIKLFSMLGMLTGMVTPRNVLGRERVMEYYNDVLYDNFDTYFNYYKGRVDRRGAMPINEPPEISVVMPLYSTDEGYTTLAIESIINQTYRDFEFIIVLNGAPATLRDLVDKYKKKDKRIVVINQQYPDIRKALNAGIGLARGKYIARQDADDISHLHRLEVQYRYMRAHHEIGFCGSDCYIIDMQSAIDRHYTGNPRKFEDIHRVLQNHNCFTHGSVMIKSSIIKQCMYSLEDHTLHCEDYDLWLRLVFNCGIKCSNIDLPLYSYRENINGVQHSNVKAMQNNARVTLTKYSDCFGSKLEVIGIDYKEIADGFKNKILDYDDLKGNQDVSILDDLCNTLDYMSVTYNIDGLDDANGKLSRYWEYTQAATAGFGGKVVLDAGSGYSIFPLLLARSGVKVYSTDYSYKDIRMYQAARLGLNIINDDYPFQNLRYPDGMFDVVYCISCIEHLKDLNDLDKSLKQFQRVIRFGGVLILSFDYYKDYIDYGKAGWKWSESTRYFNWKAFNNMVVPCLNKMDPVDLSEPEDKTNWNKPPINGSYTFAMSAFRKV
jgi:glycosyltransferase involved in cell wall biosynthesis